MTNQPRSTNLVPVITAAGALVVLAAVAFLVASGGTPAGATKPSLPPVAIASGAPSTPPASPDPSAAPPSVRPSATPKPTPKPLPVWSKPTSIDGLSGCNGAVVAIDGQGNDHVAATCDLANGGSKIKYAASSDGRSWTATTFSPPTGRYEKDPQLAFAGNTLYLAYSRVAPTDGGCGDDGLMDIGVYYRTRTLPSGKWSEPTRLGAVADELQSLRVNGSVIHATVLNEKTGQTWYESLVGSTLRREQIDTTGGTSLRVGDDGNARIAYASETGIEVGTVDGSNLSAQVIPNSKRGLDPILVLAPGNDAYVLWTRSPYGGGGGCVDSDNPDPTNGTYLSTNATGAWVTTKITSLLGGVSLALDPATGEIHVLVDDEGRIVYFHRAATTGSAWAHETLVSDDVSSAVIREDPASGDLLVVYGVNRLGSVTSTVMVMTRH